MNVANFFAQFPVAKLKKGLQIDVCDLERLIGAQQYSREYGLGVLRLIGLIESSILSARGELVTIRVVRSCLRILTDEEAVGYTVDKFKNKLKGARKAHDQMIAIEQKNLSPESVIKHDANLNATGRVVQMMDRAQRQPKLTPQQGKDTLRQTTKERIICFTRRQSVLTG